MSKKRGASIISLALSFIAISLVVAALVVALNNTREYNMAKQEDEAFDSLAYVKVYTKSEIEKVARQAFANNYLSFYDKEVDLEGLEALVIGEIEETVPASQLDNFEIIVTSDGVDVIE